MSGSKQNRDGALAEAYRQRYPVLVRLADDIAANLKEITDGQQHIDRISARGKDAERFLTKASAQVKGAPKYSEPLQQIQDQVGARIVVFYKPDVDRIDTLVRKHFRAIEYKQVVPEVESEFGYFGRHLILIVPSDMIKDDMDQSLIPQFFELQIKTLFQHAWSEADHDLGYKPGDVALSSAQKRMIAYTSAQAWGADEMFERLLKELRS